MLHSKLQVWRDAKILEQESLIQQAVMPASLEVAQTPWEFLKFTRSLPEDSSLLTQKQESRGR